jgi:hypothetical protein
MPNMGTKRLAASAKRKPAATPHASLADALFTDTQQRVLALFFGQPERSYKIWLIGGEGDLAV